MIASFAQLCHAEWIKIVGHRRAFVLLLGIFPLTALTIFTLLNLIALFDPSFRGDPALVSDWQRLTLMGWNIPSDPLGRAFLMGLTALTFAGEYQWGTWKNLTPRRRRAAILLAKLTVLSALVIATFTLTSLILGAGGVLLAAATDTSLAPPLTASAVQALVPDYALAAGLTFLAFSITALLAALAGSGPSASRHPRMASCSRRWSSQDGSPAGSPPS